MDSQYDFVRELEEGSGNVSEDKIRNIRVTPSGEKIDSETTIRTDLSIASYGDKVKEFRSMDALDCGHHVSGQNPFGGYCQAKKSLHKLKKSVCGKEYCHLCMIRCQQCNVLISRNCCTRQVGESLLCPNCARKAKLTILILLLSSLVGWAFSFLVYPFVQEGEMKDE